MKMWQADLDGRYELEAHKDLKITVKYTGYKRFDGIISPNDTIIILPYENCGVCLTKTPWHYLHFRSPFNHIESRKKFLRKKIEWYELESFLSRY